MKDYDVSVSIFASYGMTIRANSQAEANQKVRDLFTSMSDKERQKVLAESFFYDAVVDEDC